MSADDQITRRNRSSARLTAPQRRSRPMHEIDRLLDLLGVTLRTEEQPDWGVRVEASTAYHGQTYAAAVHVPSFVLTVGRERTEVEVVEEVCHQATLMLDQYDNAPVSGPTVNEWMDDDGYVVLERVPGVEAAAKSIVFSDSVVPARAPIALFAALREVDRQGVEVVGWRGVDHYPADMKVVVGLWTNSAADQPTGKAP